ncbi:hypothetical protein [Myxococcus sp. CA018]|nr:hypothetical protein [Myxococcus sp. CA018]NOK03325.1 hypothetical protein [Myxococcus xanthus]
MQAADDEPYALFRRTPQGLTTEVVGKMLRPWLDGSVPPGRGHHDPG